MATWIRPPLFFFVGGFLFLSDRLLKYFIMKPGMEPVYAWKPWLGFEYFANTGVAFSIPAPQAAVLWVTPFVLLGILLLIGRFYAKRPQLAMAGALVFLGALSNYIDRVLYHATIDYLRVATAVINLADLMIGLGALWLFLLTKRKRLPPAKIDNSL